MQTGTLSAPPILRPVCGPEVRPSLLAVHAQAVTLVDRAWVLLCAAAAPLSLLSVAVAKACLFHQAVLAVLLVLPPACLPTRHRPGHLERLSDFHRAARRAGFRVPAVPCTLACKLLKT